MVSEDKPQPLVERFDLERTELGWSDGFFRGTLRWEKSETKKNGFRNISGAGAGRVQTERVGKL